MRGAISGGGKTLTTVRTAVCGSVSKVCGLDFRGGGEKTTCHHAIFRSPVDLIDLTIKMMGRRTCWWVNEMGAAA
jgi:hypothetical protein